MPELNSKETVESQYANDSNLSSRIMLHDRYSTNKYGFYNLLFDIYEFKSSDIMLELGCGNGAQWIGRLEKLPPDSRLILSDYSEGMVGTVRRTFEVKENTK